MFAMMYLTNSVLATACATGRKTWTKETEISRVLFRLMICIVCLLDLVFGNPTVCPTANCACLVTSSNMWIINCRDRHLSQVPNFTEVETSFYEMTFSSSAMVTSACSWCNNITHLAPNSFRGVRVTRIDLTKNYISNISDSAFDGVESEVKELLLEGDGVHAFNRRAIDRLSQLTLLHLENFHIPHIGPEINFAMLPELKQLVLKRTGSASVDERTFAFSRLERLHLVQLPMTTFPVVPLSVIKSLRQLEISQTQISRLQTDSFVNLKQLTNLILSHNHLRFLDSGAFNELEDTLENLDLSGNRLENIEELSLRNWSRLQSLQLSLNKITFSPGDFLGMPVLKHLHLDHCNIKVVSSTLLQGLSLLYHLDMSQNRILEIEPMAFDHTPMLSDLILHYQQQFILQEHHLQSSVRAINLSSDSIGRNHLSLTNLDLEYNVLNETQLWSFVGKLTNLESLKLSKTNIASIPNYVFINHHRLVSLDLSRNQIFNIDSADFCGLQFSLSSLDLSYNSMTTIQECIFQNFSRLQSLSLHGNNWMCDCQITWLIHWIQTRLNHVPFSCHDTDVVCKAPSTLLNRSLCDVDPGQLECHADYKQPSCHSCDFTFIKNGTSLVPETSQLFSSKLSYSEYDSLVTENMTSLNNETFDRSASKIFHVDIYLTIVSVLLILSFELVSNSIELC
ncbi:hypothetical protein CHS0354_007751 [Potamilus streckersoni]|uniref:Uncharacterized protein n=1 Tax=Potamilus streckersoni TaxID=2493646 RepID=A0AAE0RSF6_9BIVA|nr:hypothetical protein CHS0354_007751 [Potamilus streckersoni]